MDPTIPLSEGQILAGKYQIERTLGSGGMGVVFAARHLHLGTGVAIKVLRAQACTDASTVTRFLREARAAARLQSEHVARVIDVATLDSGPPYIVMELLRGRDLADVLAADGPLPVASAVQYLLEACEALAEAHALGIVHRDLKPANLFLATRADGSLFVKVLDFGISKTLPTGEGGASAGAATATGAIFGTPFYMSPEQIRSARDVDARTDVWSLGALFYELLTGRKPFVSESLPAVFVMIAGEAPAPPRTHRPDLPFALEAVILACLEKDPARRVQSVADLALRLAPFAPAGAAVLVERVQRLGRPLHAPAASSPAAAPSQDRLAPAATGRAWGGETAPRAYNRAAFVIAGGVLVAAIAAAAAFLPRVLPRTKSAAAPTSPATTTSASPAPVEAVPVPSATLSNLGATPSATGPSSAAASSRPGASPSVRRPTVTRPVKGGKDESSPTVE